LEVAFQIEGCSEVNSVSVLVNGIVNDVKSTGTGYCKYNKNGAQTIYKT